MSADKLAQALRRLIAELPVRVANDQQLISMSAAHIEGIGQACVKVLQAIEALAAHQAQQAEPAGYVTAIKEGKVLMLPRASLDLSKLVPLYAAPQQAQAPGWQLVPVEPTPEMKKAAVVYGNGNAVYKNVAREALEIEESIYGEVYAAMLAVAPQQGSNT